MFLSDQKNKINITNENDIINIIEGIQVQLNNTEKYNCIRNQTDYYSNYKGKSS